MTVIEAKQPLLTRREAAKYLGVQPQTLAVWACTKRYKIPYIRVGNSVRYRLVDLNAWLKERTVGGDSDPQ